MKFVFLGEEGVGKTSLLMAYSKGCVPKVYVPTVFDSYSLNVSAGNVPYKLSLFDTSGQDKYGKLRPLSYPNTDIFLICFSIVSPESFHKIKDKFVPEVKKHCPKARIFIVGTQVDLRNDLDTVEKLAKNRLRPVAEAEGEQLAHELGAIGYFECSALTKVAVTELFKAAIASAIEKDDEQVENVQSARCACTIS
ncbi:unnamed protein product [Caenorhabditis auriculariae]|uniref:Uncharacterized protein n=1 Tax=Caenorhabditis auriculariae TaxID=2777116 RepID=A0A8S1HC76_9PELO|nr:unnamed protein product [Caenorhabditis auriculariae]